MRHQYKLKLTKLPYLALANIFQYLDSIDLLNLSLLSKRLMNAISMCNLGTAVCIITLRTTFRREVSIRIITNESTLTWKFAKKHIQRRMAIDGPISPLTLGETTLESCARHSGSNTLYTFGASLDDDSLDCCITVVANHLFFLFSCTVRIDMDQKVYTKLPELFNLLPDSKCEKLSLRADDKTSKENVEAVLEKMGSLKSLDIGCYKGEAIGVEKIANLESLRLNDAFWLPSESLVQLNGRHIELTENSFDAKVIKGLVDQWFRGERENLEVFTFHYHDKDNFDHAFLFDNIEDVHGWCEQERHRFYRINEDLACDCQTGIDFMRHDGKLATFLFEETKMHFLIWNERFPDFSLPAGQYFTQVQREDAIYKAAYPTPIVFSENRDVIWDQLRRFQF